MNKQEEKKQELRHKNNLLENLLLFLRGLFMGFCDIIPGVSGGTIALISGIYKRLIESVHAITSLPAQLIKNLFSKKSLKTYTIKKHHFTFLLLVGLGVLVGLFISAHIITYALEVFFIPTMMFFVGLIIASAHHLYKKISKHSKKSWTIASIFFLVGISLAFLQSNIINIHAWWYYLIIGTLASFAMLLPGVSGSFILLVFGVYEVFLQAVQAPHVYLSTLFIFAIGIFLGFLFISKIISYYFHKNTSITLCALIGLLLGATSVPLSYVLHQSVLWTFAGWILAGMSFLLGFLLVILVDYLAHRTRLNTQKKQPL